MWPGKSYDQVASAAQPQESRCRRRMGSGAEVPFRASSSFPQVTLIIARSFVLLVDNDLVQQTIAKPRAEYDQMGQLGGGFLLVGRDAISR
jgi:hypothetical protein